MPTCLGQGPGQPSEQNQRQSVQILFTQTLRAKLGLVCILIWSGVFWRSHLAGAQIKSRAFLDSIGPVDVNLSQTFLFPYSVPGTRVAKVPSATKVLSNAGGFESAVEPKTENFRV
jgi:hypothetical protein